MRLQYAENPGGFLSVGAHFPRSCARVCSPSVTASHCRDRGRRDSVSLEGWPLVGLLLFVAGGASNLIDRVAHGNVIDFINVGIGPLRTGIFNVADVGIMLGIAIVLVNEVLAQPRLLDCATFSP